MAVKRYTFDVDSRGDRLPYPIAIEIADGDWVEYSDLLSVERERDKLRDALQAAMFAVSDLDETGAYNEERAAWRGVIDATR